jgi:hypothetical protein
VASVTFSPIPGQIVLVEPGRPGGSDITGLVGTGDGERFEVDLGLDAVVPSDGGQVVVSVCAPDALYRLKATSTPGTGRGIMILSDIQALERIQRRTAARVPIRLGVSLGWFEEPAGEIKSVAGYTIDVGVGGVQVQTLRPLPEGDPTVMLTLPDGTTIAALSLVLQTLKDGDSWRSRLSFQDLPADGMTALSALVNAHLPAA